MRSRAGPKTTSFIFSSYPTFPSSLLRRLRTSIRFFHNSKARRNGKPASPDPTPNLNTPKGSGAKTETEANPQSLGARMRKLSREYGWSALGVYFALTAVDFPFCYLFVRTLGTDRIGKSWFSLDGSMLFRLGYVRGEHMRLKDSESRTRTRNGIVMLDKVLLLLEKGASRGWTSHKSDRIWIKHSQNKNVIANEVLTITLQENGSTSSYQILKSLFQIPSNKVGTNGGQLWRNPPRTFPAEKKSVKE